MSETRSLSMKLITATSVVSTAPHVCTWSGKGFAACAGQPQNSEKFRKSCRGLRKLRLQKPPRFLGTTTDFNDGLLVCLDSVPTKYVKYAMWVAWQNQARHVQFFGIAIQTNINTSCTTGNWNVIMPPTVECKLLGASGMWQMWAILETIEAGKSSNCRQFTSLKHPKWFFLLREAVVNKTPKNVPKMFFLALTTPLSVYIYIIILLCYIIILLY